MPDPEEWPVALHQHSARIVLVYCFFDLRGCFWSVVHAPAIVIFAQGGVDLADRNRQEKHQLPKRMKMTPQLIFVSTCHTGGALLPVTPTLNLYPSLPVSTCCPKRNEVSSKSRMLIFGKMIESGIAQTTNTSYYSALIVPTKRKPTCW
jgi:hypothetical protein